MLQHDQAIEYRIYSLIVSLSTTTPLKRTLLSSNHGSAISSHPSRRFIHQGGPFYTLTAHSGTNRLEEPFHSPAITVGYGKIFTTGAPQAPLSTRRSSPSKQPLNGPAPKALRIPSYSSITRPRFPPPLILVYAAVSWQAFGSTVSLWTVSRHPPLCPSQCATARLTLVSRATNGPTDSPSSAPP